MKTTLEVSDALMLEAKRVAQANGTTLRALVEEGLRDVLGRMQRRQRFVLRDGSVGGEGLQSDQDQLAWPEVRAMIYGDRG